MASPGIKLSPADLANFKETPGIKLSDADLASFREDGDPEQSTMFRGAGSTFAAKMFNPFGLGPVVTGLTAKLQGHDYATARDEARRQLGLAEEENPIAAKAGGVASIGSEMALGGVLGKVAGAGAKGLGFATSLRLGSPLATSVAKGVAGGAAYGAAGGAGEALSEGRDVLPAALHGGAVGGLLGGVVGGVAHGIGKAFKGAGAKAEQDMLQGVAQGEGTLGSATVKTKKLMANIKPNILLTLREDPLLLKASRKLATEAEPVFRTKLEELGSKLDPLYQHVDQATGGVSVRGLVDHLDAEIRELAKQPLSEVYTNGLAKIRDSLTEAWAPGWKAANKTVDDLIAQGIPKVRIPKNLLPADVLVPTREARKVVTQLQTRATDVLGGLTPGETAKAKAEFAAVLKDYLDSHLDVAGGKSALAEQSVKAIRELNKRYSAVATMLSAIQQRGWKEATGSVTGKGLAGGLLKKGTLIGAGAMAMHGNIPGAIGSLAMHQVVDHLPQMVRGGNAKLAQLAALAEQGNPGALKILAAVQQGRRAGLVGSGAVGSNVATTMGAADAGQ